MSYTLIRECTIVLYYKGKGYRFDSLSNFSFSQTFSRTNTPRQTLHSKTAKPLTIANSRSPASFSATVLATNTYSERVFFELVGMEPQSVTDFVYPDSIDIQPEECEIYVVNDSVIFRLDKAHIQNVDILFALDSPLALNVAFTAASLDRVRTLPLGSGLIEQGDPLKPSSIQLYMNNRLVSNVVNAGTTIQQTVNWRNDQSLHDIGKIYDNRVATLSNMSFTATITTYLTKNIQTPDEPFLTNVRIAQSGVLYDMRNVLAIKRFTPEDIFQESFDIALTEDTERVVVEYGGLLT